MIYLKNMKLPLARSWLKALSNLSINLSAGWFATVLIVPAFRDRPEFLLSLTLNLLYGILFLYGSVRLESILEHYD